MKLISCVIMLLHVPLWAAQPYVPEFVNPFEEPWRFRTFSELEGLGATCLTEDADGNMWFGVVDGAMRFDGIEWRLFTEEDGLFPGPVRVFHKTDDGRLYAGSDYGLSIYHSGHWVSVYPTHGIPRMAIKDIVSDRNGVVWVASSWGLLRIEKDQYALYTTPQLGQVFQKYDKNIIIRMLPDAVIPRIGANSSMGAILTGGFFEQYLVVYPPVTIQALLPNGPAAQAGLSVGDQITNVDRANALDGMTEPVLLKVQREGVSEPFDVSVEPMQGYELMQVFDAYSLAVAPDGSLWVGLYSGDVAHLTFDENTKVQIVSTRLFTPHDFIAGFGPRILVRKNGDVWLVNESFESPVQVFDGTTWRPVADYTGRQINFSIFETRNGAVFVGGVSNFWVYENGLWQDSNKIDAVDLPTSRPQFYETQSGVIWMLGLGQSVFRMDYASDRWTTFKNVTYQCDDQNGNQWFLGYVGEELCVVKKTGDTWISYTLEDGLIDHISGIQIAQDRVWATGSHYGVAAVALLENDTWHKTTFPRLGNKIRDGGYVAPDGTWWLGAHPNFDPELGHLGGVLRLRPGQDFKSGWAHFTPPDAPVSVYGAGQAPDGKVWFAYGQGVRGFDGETWSLPEPVPLRNSPVDDVVVGVMGDLYFLSRSYGVFHLKDGVWQNYTTQDGLPDNTIKKGLALDGGQLIVETANNTAGFDQGHWRQDIIFLQKLKPDKISKSRDGFWWFSKAGQPSEPRSWRYRPDKEAPVVRFIQAPTKVSSDGNTFITWQGIDPWNISPDDKLDYSYRLNDDPWRSYTKKKEAILNSLSPGDYRFEVKARDQDFNATLKPAMIHFTVAPPTWREPWFLALCFGFLVLITSQTMRVIRRDKKLQVVNQTLEKQVEEIREAQRETEQARLEAETANQSKSIFLANMSHEIRTPMNAILGYAQILNNDVSLNPEHKRAIQTIGQSGEHLLGLINDILDISKIEAGHEKLTQGDFNLKVMLDGLSSMFDMRCRQKDLMWYLKADVGENVVKGDEKKLRQILINLVGNAVKFTEHGSVTLTVTALENDFYRFEVADTGQGIKKEKQALIFEPFQQDEAGIHHGGTGLGLAISVRHVEMMGGTIALESAEGEGAKFSFTVVLSPGRQDNKNKEVMDWSRVSHLADGHEVQALVVDDVQNNIDILARLLSNVGVQVRTAQSGKEALDVLSESLPHIVFTDIRMPAMDGVELLKRILDEYGERAPKMIATTASVFEHQRQQYVEWGFDAFVNKPVQIENIYACMAEQLGVTYSFVETDGAASEPEAEMDWQNFVLPAQLLIELKKAVDDASITDLRERVQALSEMENMHAFVNLLRERLQRYDFDGIGEILDQVKAE